MNAAVVEAPVIRHSKLEELGDYISSFAVLKELYSEAVTLYLTESLLVLKVVLPTATPLEIFCH